MTHPVARQTAEVLLRGIALAALAALICDLLTYQPPGRRERRPK